MGTGSIPSPDFCFFNYFASDIYSANHRPESPLTVHPYSSIPTSVLPVIKYALSALSKTPASSLLTRST